MAADNAKFILQLIDKVSGPSKTITRALGRTSRLFDKLHSSVNGRGVGRRSLERFTAQSSRMQSALGGLGRRMRSTERAGMGMMDVFKGNLLASAAEKVLSVGVSAGGAAADFVTFGQNQRLAFDQLAKHGANGTKLFQHTRDLAKEFGLDVKHTSKSYAKFLALQFNPNEADKLIKMGADLRVLGNDAENVQGVFTALGQIKSKGRLQAEEMLQLAERGISQGLVWEQIGKSIGKSVDEVRKLQEQGGIKADLALPAIEQAINVKLNQKAIGDSGKKWADTTIEGAIGKMKARGQDVALTLSERFEAGASKALTRVGERLAEFIESPRGQKFIDQLGRGIEMLGKGLEKAVPLMESFAGGFGEGAGQALKTFGEALDPLFKALGSGDGSTANAVLKTLGENMGYAAVTASFLGAGFVALAGGVGAVGTALIRAGVASVLGFLEPLKKMIGDVGLWWDDLKAVWNAKGMSLTQKAGEIGEMLVKGLTNGMKRLAMLPIEQAKSMGDGVVAAFKSTFGIHSPAKATIEIGAYLGKGLPIGLASEVSAAERAIQKHYGAGSRVMGAFTDIMIPQPDFGPAIGSFAAGADANAASVPGGDVNVTLRIQEINVSAQPGADGREQGRALGREMRRELELVFAELNLQG